jgi:hypothetical protein
VNKEIKTFKTTVLGVGPFCIEFPDDEIITTHSEERQRLISAASDLLEALKLFCDVNPSSLHINEVCRRHSVARAAIAKAEGRQ